MSVDEVTSKHRIQLRVVSMDQNQDLEDVDPDVDGGDVDGVDGEKKLKRRGRPRKTPQDEVNLMEATDPEPKKRGRKKKPELSLSVSSTGLAVIVKSYIVQLKVKACDLNKSQASNQVFGYNPDHHSTHNQNHNDNGNDNHNEYFKLLNNLELPWCSSSTGSSSSSSSSSSTSSSSSSLTGGRRKLPDLPMRYLHSVIAVLPNHVPIQLFDELSADGNTSHQSDEVNPLVRYGTKAYRSTTNLVLPQFDRQNQTWPQSSPYPCWNCDVYFDGTPVGIVDKEVNGHFHCFGNFCGFSCSARYLVDRENSVDFWAKYSLLCLLYQKAGNLPPTSKVPIAPPREALIKYGGQLTHDEYHQTDRKVEVYKLPLVPVMLHIDELNRATNINSIIEKNQNKAPTYNNPVFNKTKRFVGVDPAKLKKAEENTKQKQQERLHSNHTLDDCFNLK